MKKDSGELKIGCYKGNYDKTASIDISIESWGCYFE